MQRWCKILQKSFLDFRICSATFMRANCKMQIKCRKQSTLFTFFFVVWPFSASKNFFRCKFLFLVLFFQKKNQKILFFFQKNMPKKSQEI